MATYVARDPVTVPRHVRAGGVKADEGRGCIGGRDRIRFQLPGRDGVDIA